MNTSFVILIVDDNQNNLFTMRTLLQLLPNCKIVEASSGKEALACVIERKIDLILLDVQMPEMDGFETARHLQMTERTREIPIIFLTAVFKADEFARRGYANGAVDYLTKPIDDNLLCNRINLYRRLNERENKLNETINSLAERTVELSKQKAQLETINQELESFSYSVSHDLRSPLRGIDGWTAVLLEDYSSLLDEKAQSYLTLVRNEAQRMGGLIDALLKLSTITRIETRIQEVNLSELAKIVYERILKENPDRCVQVKIEPNLITKGDRTLLEIALNNLFSNAYKFTSKIQNAEIEFSTTQINENNMYFVRDNGVGYNPNYSQKLFGPFQRMHKQSEYPGTGIGLAIVKRIISAHNGEIFATSELNKGATFYFSIHNHLS